MVWRRESSRAGYIRIRFRSDACLDVKLGDWQALCEAAEFGIEWVPVTDVYGELNRVRMAEVESFGACTPASLAAFDAEEDERLAHERLNGESA